MNIPELLHYFMPKDIADYIYWEFSSIPITKDEVRLNHKNVLHQLYYYHVMKEFIQIQYEKQRRSAIIPNPSFF